MAWLALNYAMNPTAFVADWHHELFSRTMPFVNVRLVLAIGLGAMSLVLFGTAVGAWEDVSESMREIRRAGLVVNAGPSPLTWWLVLFGAFVLYRTPDDHQ